MRWVPNGATSFAVVCTVVLLGVRAAAAAEPEAPVGEAVTGEATGSLAPDGAVPPVAHQAGYFQHVLRLHSRITHVRDGAERGLSDSWMTGAGIVSLARSDQLTHVTIAAGELGGGGAGLDGSATLGLAYGGTLLGSEHTPFARGAARLALRGNRDYFFSSLELPGVEVGYQYASRELLFEAGADAGLVVDGRYRIYRRNLAMRGALLGGGHLALSHQRPSAQTLLMARLVRIAADHPLTAFELRVCSSALGILLTCTTAEYYEQTLPWSAGEQLTRRVIVTGLSVGLGRPVVLSSAAGSS